MPLILDFGSRSASWVALGIFTIVFAVVGWAVARELTRRSRGEQTMVARLLGVAMFLGPVTSVYAGMLSGFYQAEVSDSTIRMRYLLPGVVAEAPHATVTARVAPAYRNRARLIISAGGRQFESAPWPRASVNESLARLKLKLDP